MEEQLIIFVPSNKTYTLSDVVSTLSKFYGDVTNTIIWNNSNDGIWYHFIINLKKNNDELITKFKAELFDNTCTITIKHKNNSNDALYYDINVCSYKYWLFYNYEEIIQKKNNEIIKLTTLNEQLQKAINETNHP